MYSVQIEFSDGSQPIVKRNMTRAEYGRRMRSLELHYRIEIQQVETLSDKSTMIFARATSIDEIIKNLERRKSRARYYARTNGETGKGHRLGSDGEG